GASGFLAGRAIWKDAFREKTLAAQMEYVRTQGVKNFQALADLAHRYARPWWTSTAEKRSCRITSRDGTSSTEVRRRPDLTLAEHAGKVDRDLGLLLSRFAGLVSRIRRELPIRRDPAATRNAYGEQQLELDVRMK